MKFPSDDDPSPKKHLLQDPAKMKYATRLAKTDDFWPAGPEPSEVTYAGQKSDPADQRELLKEELAQSQDTLTARLFILAQQLAEEMIPGHPQLLTYRLARELLWADDVTGGAPPELGWTDEGLQPPPPNAPGKAYGDKFKYVLICQFCGESFAANRSHAKYHSPSCRTRDCVRRRDERMKLEIPGYFHDRVKGHQAILEDAYRWSDDLEGEGMVKAALYLRLAAKELIDRDAEIAASLSSVQESVNSLAPN